MGFRAVKWMNAFYGKRIDRDDEQKKIEKLLSKYKRIPVSEELKKSIYNDLAAAKARGEIAIPFKVVMRKDTSGNRHHYVEVILDTKV